MNETTARAIDWAAIRKAYEKGDAPVRVIAVTSVPNSSRSRWQVSLAMKNYWRPN
jgi:hypothetical protein